MTWHRILIIINCPAAILRFFLVFWLGPYPTGQRFPFSCLPGYWDLESAKRLETCSLLFLCKCTFLVQWFYWDPGWVHSIFLDKTLRRQWLYPHRFIKRYQRIWNRDKFQQCGPFCPTQAVPFFMWSPFLLMDLMVVDCSALTNTCDIGNW